jgi:hypothetical protein
MGKLDVVGAVAAVLAMELAACTPTPVPVRKETSRPTSTSTTNVGTATATPSVGGADAGPKACTKNADCLGDGVCNCRCAPAPAHCDGPIDVCGDCWKYKMVGVCLRDCEGG